MKNFTRVMIISILANPVPNLYAESTNNININSMLIADASNVTDSNETVQNDTMGQSNEPNISLLPEDTIIAGDDLYGIEGGYAHPYLSIAGEFTDNLYNVDTDKTENFLTRLSPGIWFTVPRKMEIPVTITPLNTAPGGLPLQLGDYDGTDRYQLYALAGTDLLFYSEDSDLNTLNLDLEGLARYNMASGLSFQILDRFDIGHDGFGVGAATEENQREFNTNLVMVTADYDITEKLRFKVDVSNFYLSYDKEINSFLERQDNSLDLYAFFKYSLKTSFFVEYKYTDIAYDSAIESDNSQNFYYGGLRWDTTEKLALLFKAGLQQKEFNETRAGYSDSDNLTLDLQVLYRLTEKTEITIDGYKLNEESDSAIASEKDVVGIRFGYEQKFTEKITGTLDIFYENADYAQLTNSDRDEDRFEITPGLQYLFKDWLMAEISYSYETLDSSDDIFDYDTNTVMLSLNASF